MATNGMNGKTCLVTGATSGIGLKTAEGLAAAGAHIVVVGRNEQKVAALVAKLGPATGSHVADLSNRDDVRRLAQEVQERYDSIDVLINNAGAFYQRRQESADGVEMTFALNHLAPFLLTNLLLDYLKAGGPARIVTVASMAHKGAKLDFDDLEGKPKYGSWKAYGRSKLANILFTYELARRLEGTGVTANCLHPGFVASKFGHNNSGPVKVVIGLIQRLFAISEEKGALTSIHAASSAEVEGVSGKYFIKSKEAASSSASHDEDAQARLWQISAEMVGLEQTAA